MSRFTEYLSQFPDLLEQLNQGQNTVLIPDDTACAQLSDNRDMQRAEIQAILQYHSLRQAHPSATFSETPFFPVTLLENTTTANVTEGQRVECIVVDESPVVRSALKTVSLITKPVRSSA